MDTTPDADLEELASQIERGEDTISIPEALTVEPPREDPETKSLYGRIQAMTVGQRIKLALKGSRDARAILVRDPNRIVQRFVLQNPRITEDEVLMICKNRNTDSDLLRIVTENREWLRSYQVKLALVQNPKTPLPVSLHFVGALMDRDVRFLAKNKNVPSAVSTRARRLLAEREHKQK